MGDHIGWLNIKARLRPSPNQTHAECAAEDQKTGEDSLLSPKHPPALIAQEILRHQLDERGEDKKTGRDGVHGAHDKQPNFRIGAV